MASSKWDQYVQTPSKWDKYASDEPDVPAGLKGMDLPNPGLSGLNKARTAVESSMAPRAYLADPMPGSQPTSYDPTGQPTIPGGVERVIHGVEHTAQPGLDSKAHGVSEVIRGIGTAAAPLAAPALAAAPAATIGAGLLGLGAQSGTEAGLNALGASPGVSSLAGDAAGIVGGGLGSKAAGRTLGKLPSLADDFFHTNTRTALVKAYKPGANDPNFIGHEPLNEDVVEGLPTAAAHIKAANGGHITSNEHVIPAASKAIQGHQQAFNRWIANAKQNGVTHISGDSVLKATTDAIPETMWQEDPMGAQKIVDEARAAYGGKRIPLDKAHAIVKEKTQDLASFYNKAPGAQQQALGSTKPVVVQKAQRDAMADTLYNALDPANNGAGPRQIKRQMSHIIDVKDVASKKRNSIIAEKATSKAGKVGKVASNLASVPGKVLHGDVQGAADKLMHPIDGPTDALIKDAFKHVGPAEALPEPYQFSQPRALLGPGAVQMPPIADPSGAFSAPPPMPQASTRMLPSPVQFQQPGFAVASDLVPIHDPKTGQITYQPQWMQQSAGPLPLK